MHAMEITHKLIKTGYTIFSEKIKVVLHGFKVFNVSKWKYYIGLSVSVFKNALLEIVCYDYGIGLVIFFNHYNFIRDNYVFIF